MKTKSIPRILLIEPSQLVRESIKILLKENGSYDLVAAYADVSQLQERCAMHRVDIVLFNPILMSYQNRATIRSFFNLSLNLHLVAIIYSFVVDILLQQFDAILSINDDISIIANKLQALPTKNIGKLKSRSEELSEREIDVLKLLALGKANKEIADKLNISIHTVISHRKNITQKTGIKSVSGLTIYAVVQKIISTETIQL